MVKLVPDPNNVALPTVLPRSENSRSRQQSRPKPRHISRSRPCFELKTSQHSGVSVFLGRELSFYHSQRALVLFGIAYISPHTVTLLNCLL